MRWIVSDPDHLGGSPRVRDTRISVTMLLECLASGMTIRGVLASGTGLPISTTHTLVGAVLGVGVARGIAAINLRVAQQIFMSWIITLPAGAILSMIFYFALKGMLT